MWKQLAQGHTASVWLDRAGPELCFDPGVLVLSTRKKPFARISSNIGSISSWVPHVLPALLEMGTTLEQPGSSSGQGERGRVRSFLRRLCL